MSKRPSAVDVIRKALQQYRYTEHPAGSNRTKYGEAFGLNGQPWCAEFVWWAGWIAAGKDQAYNPFAHNANAAYIQDKTVKTKKGRYILKQTANNKKKKEALPKYKTGDEVSFNFNGGTSRVHTGLIVGTYGNTVYCIEGNTSLTDAGSQSNGGAVAYRTRNYTNCVCVVRPNYAPVDWYEPKEAYDGKTPKLPKRGYFKYNDSGSEVKKLQEALSWANGYDLAKDGEFGSYTFAEVILFQVKNGLVPDGEFGPASLKALETTIKKKKQNQTDAVKKTSAEKLIEEAERVSYAYGTPKARRAYPGGKPKEAYAEDLAKAYPDRKRWGKQTRAGASCDVCAGVIIRAAGIDKTFPRGLDEEDRHVKNHPETWERIKMTSRKQLQPGDVVRQIYKSGAGHIVVYLGHGRVANAHYYGKSYPVIESESKKVKDPKDCKSSYIYRAK